MHPSISSPPVLLDLPGDMPFVARRVLRVLRNMKHGSLLLDLPDGRRVRLGQNPGQFVVLKLKNWNVFGAVLRSGDIGLAETYMAGDWTTSSLSELFRLALDNRQALETLVYGSWWGQLAYRLRHLLRRNTRAASRRNIRAHYDLGNDFYQLWLDLGMNYSSAWFQGDLQGDLALAQEAKLRRALDAVAVQPGERLLEIGCGWGGLAEMAAIEKNVQVTGVTLSTEQWEYGRARMAASGRAAQVDLRLQDYRDINDGPYDALCSIEMVEAVGEEYWPTYFESLRRLLKPGGRACIQSIVIEDSLFERYVKGTDFIQQYIFPGGCLPSPQRFREAAANAGLRVVEEFAFGADYAETLRRWRYIFNAKAEAVMQQGFDLRFMRTWEFYLAYCEAAFDAGDIDVVQYTLVRE